MTPREDALTIGARLKAEYREQRAQRIENVLRRQPADYGNDYDVRFAVAEALYKARWDGRRYDDKPDAAEVLQTFCWNLLGCSYEEALEAWDRYLG